MDIAKYIGVYLLKNKFCYLPGFGNLEITKVISNYDGHTLSPAKYEVTLTGKGSVDDTLANFIASQEQVSISKASNAIKDFSNDARNSLSEGKEIILPALGKIVSKNGKNYFESDSNFTYSPNPIAILKTERTTDETFNSTDQKTVTSSENNTNLLKIILWILGATILSVACFFGYNYMIEKNNNPTQKIAPKLKDTVSTAIIMSPIDTVQPTPSTSKPNTPTTSLNTSGQLDYKVIIKEYNSKPAAEKMMKTLTGNGNKVELITKDANNFLITIPLTTAVADTAHAIDSLRKFFNPKGAVRIYK